MGRRIKEKITGGKKYIAVSGNSEDKANFASHEEEIEEQSEDYLDVTLVNVDFTVQRVTRVSNKVFVRGLSVYSNSGKLGDIPRKYADRVSEGRYSEGAVLNIDVVRVRLFA